MNAQVQVVHEALTQRQHVRVKMPLTVKIGSRKFKAIDWSVAGLAFSGMTPVPEIGERPRMVLQFGFAGFSFGMHVEGEVKRADADSGEVGVNYVNLSKSNLSLLQYLIGAYLAGETVSHGDLLAIVKRNNFTPARKSPMDKEGEVSVFAVAQRVLMIGLLWAIALALVAFIGVSAYHRAFVVKADGLLASPDARIVRAPKAGTVLSIDAQPGTQVYPDQLLVSLETADNTIQSLKSDCECIVGESLTAAGAFLSKGAPLVSLVPVGGKLSAEFILPLEQVGRVKLGDRALVTFYSDGREATGRVERIVLPTFGETNTFARVSEGLIQITAIVRVTFDQRLPAHYVGQPAAVKINTLRLL